MGVYNFSLFQAFTASYMLVENLRNRGRGGVLRRNNLMKWEFYSEADVEFLAYFLMTRQTHTFQIQIQKGQSIKRLN